MFKKNIEKIYRKALKIHEKYKGKIEMKNKIKMKSLYDLSVLYTPGVAAPCLKIKDNNDLVYKYTNKGNTIAIVTDGSAVLGLGNIGAKASIPVMEGKAFLFKKFGNIDAIPICLNTQDPDEIVSIIRNISPVFGAINIEDISAPKCFYIEEQLKKNCNIPIFHDDQHGTAVVVLAALINSFKILKNKNFNNSSIVISGAGAAGIAITKLLLKFNVKNIILCDKKGIIYNGRKEGMNFYKEKISKITNKNNLKGNLKDALKKSDIFIGVSAPNIVTGDMIKSMNKDPIILSLSNPIPEIMPNIAIDNGAKIVCTGMSNFPNQVNNVLAFPGILRGVLDSKVKYIDYKIKIAASFAIANSIKDKDLNEFNIIPDPLKKNTSKNVAKKINELVN